MLAFTSLILSGRAAGTGTVNWEVSGSTEFATWQQYEHAPPEPMDNKNANPLRKGELTDILMAPHMDDAALSVGAFAIAKASPGARIMSVTMTGEGERPLDPFDTSKWSPYLQRSIAHRIIMKDFLQVYEMSRNVPEYLYCGEEYKGIGPFQCPDYQTAAQAPGVERLSQFAKALEVPLQYLSANGTLHFPAAMGDQTGMPHPDHMATSETALQFIAKGQVKRGLMWLDVPYIFMGHCNATGTYTAFCQEKVNARMAQIQQKHPELVFKKVVHKYSFNVLVQQVRALFTYNTQIWDSALFVDNFPPCGKGIDRDTVLGEYMQYSQEFAGCASNEYCTVSFEVERKNETLDSIAFISV
jgi:LmbE family N-acetylglucosaminyl deacetylase